MLLAAGFVREGCARECVRKNEGYVDEHVFGLLRREWEANRPEQIS
ncbi:hypothetical protein ENSA5_58610 [Enhygromyxa salina]|uniref:N-acetyltransferase domain-containing protein n=1 Tax=Enhygromyxa salina TaxID=215803 RepID=A0A2S9XE36_9BACT|nr:hypothetical protein ENSA5_58610 [Enhygromyxa salina]